MAGWRVLTRPPSISGLPVTSLTARTGMPASAMARRVPPVEISSKPISCRRRAMSTIPVLSHTLNRARIGGQTPSVAGQAVGRTSGSPVRISGMNTMSRWNTSRNRPLRACARSTSIIGYSRART